MLNWLRHLRRNKARLVELLALQQWAQDRGYGFRRAREGQGCVIECRQGMQAWRAEWGASQRSYIPGFELRLIADLDLPGQLMAMVINRDLMMAMEKIVYEQFVDDVQTRIDTDTPSEMRWLVMCNKLSTAQLGRLMPRYGAVCSVAPWLVQWLTGRLNDALAATIDQVDAAHPVVLTVARGRLTLRTAMPVPNAAGLALWFSVFEHALREASRLGGEWRQAAGGGLTTQPAAWSSSELVRT